MSTLALLGGSPVRTKPLPQHDTRIGHRERAYVDEVMASGILSGFAGKYDERWAGGTMVKRAEAAAAARFGSRHCVMFHSGTAAIQANLAVAGIQPGDEVIVPGLGWTTSGSTVLSQGAVPVFCDIDPVTFQMDPAKAEALITPRTKAIATVNLFGMAAGLDTLRAVADRAGVPLLEDNCHAYGMRYKGRYTGTFGLVSAVSFNYHKIIQCGEGGAALTDDDEVALKLRLWRNHGENICGAMGRADLPGQLGYNHRPTELSAAVTLGQLEQFDELVSWKQDLAQRLTAKLSGHRFLTPPHVPPESEMNYYVYALTFDPGKAGVHRDTFCAALKAEGVWANPGYVNPIYRQPMYRSARILGDSRFPFVPGITDRDPAELYRDGICPVAESLHDERLITVIWLKYPYTAEDVDEFVHAVEKVEANLEDLAAWERARASS